MSYTIAFDGKSTNIGTQEHLIHATVGNTYNLVFYEENKKNILRSYCNETIKTKTVGQNVMNIQF